MLKKNIFGVIFLFLILSITVIFSETNYEQINAIFNDAGYAPFHMKPDKSGGELKEGIVVDLLNEFQKEYKNYKITIIGLPKKREQISLDYNKADLSYNSPLFTGDRAKNFIWSEPFVKSKDCVVMLKDNQFKFEKPEDLFGKKVGKIRGFGYGEFDNLFEEKKIIGYDVTDSIQLIAMLKKHRIDCFFGNTYVTPYEIKLNNEDMKDFYFSDKSLYEFELMFQINKNKTKLKEDLDKFIIKAKENGLLKKIEAKYK
ncbi:MAG: hypothetical protein A2086_15790 [Spirochaetes bacterium GWD1_27_9]|nr:MAG: hypothetical protein A2Z98_11060 [Spirochaetes bacterium GWB1_27_13]OHD27092.1 MAG: hypothetical protein A2Y34_11380 [Spirochaetes bacterium GWC1_27_15]OHD42841.1 MAG: hypothetical protein A2086_15790 [Spirochaetes bacterium GWD1_27_9]